MRLRPPSPAAPSADGFPARPGTVLVVVSAAVFLASLDLFIVNIAFPDIRLAFHGSSLGSLSWILNGYTVVFAAFLALAGRLADRYGRRRLFLVGIAVFTLASAACAGAVSVEMLVAFRAVQALGAALVMPTSLALLLTAFPAERRTTAVGIWSAVGGLAASLGPPLGGLLVEASWRWIFLVNVPVGIATLIAGRRVLRESAEPGSGRPDVLGAIGLVVGVGALAWALVRAPDHGWTGAPVLLGFAVAVLGLAWVTVRSRRHPVPALDLVALRVPVFACACLAVLLFSVGFAAMLFGNVLFLTEIWGYSIVGAGLALMPGPLVVIPVSMLAGRLAPRFGPGPLIVAGAISFGLGAVWWLWHVDADPAYLADLFPGQLFTGTGVGLILPSTSGIVGSALPPARWGVGSSMINTSRQIGSVLGIATLVVVYGPVQDLTAFRHGWVFIVLTAAGALAAGAAITLGARRSRRPAIAPAPIPAAAVD